MGRKPITMAPRMLLAVFVAGVALACAIQPSFEVGAARLERDTSLVVSNLDVESFVDVTEAADVAVVEAVATLLKSDVAAEAYTAVMEGAGASATCGDGMRQGTEECDDGNTLPNDGCNAQWKVDTSASQKRWRAKTPAAHAATLSVPQCLHDNLVVSTPSPPSQTVCRPRKRRSLNV